MLMKVIFMFKVKNGCVIAGSPSLWEARNDIFI
jgi:hypothetical protein